MKLRFDKQTLRLRLSESDLDQLKQDGFVEALVIFPNGSLAYRLQADPTIEESSCSYNDHLIEVFVPLQLVLAWIESEEEGIYTTVPTPGQAAALRIMIEKDFPCKHTSPTHGSSSF